MLNKKWYPSQSPASPKQQKPKSWNVVYWKHIKDSSSHNGKIIATVTGKTKEEVEEIVKHICDLHNNSLT